MLIYKVMKEDKFIGMVDARSLGAATEIGYWLVEDETGKGYGTKVVAMLTEELVKRDTKTIIANTDINNHPSNKLLIDLGFKKVRVEDQDVLYERNL